jgi:GntR family transcriptional repressor for pyruvate dehydrogenase complex
MAVTDEAILQIKEMILRGELAPGDRLPPEKELSEQLGISRSSMREAVKALELIRVLDVRRGDGTFVTSLEPRLLIEAISFVVDLHADSSILELFVVRRICEGAAAALAASRVTPAEITALRSQIKAVEASTDVEALVAHDIEFHGAIAAAAGNTYLLALIESLSSRTARARIWRGLTQENAVARTLDEHAAIVSALEIGDPLLAESLAVTHVSGVEQWIRARSDSAEPFVDIGTTPA